METRARLLRWFLGLLDRLTSKSRLPDPEPRVIPPDDEVFAVYKAIAPTFFAGAKLMFLNVTAFFLPALLLWSFFANGLNSRLSFGLGAATLICFLFVLYGKLFPWLTFTRFRSFRKRLPFQIVGWENLVGSPHFTSRFHWRNCSIEIQTKSPDANEVLGAALYLFCERVNFSCYYATLDEDKLKPWESTMDESHRATGVVNCSVVRCMLNLFAKLASIQNQHASIERVQIRTEGNEFHVAAESSL